MKWKLVIASNILDIRDGTHDSPKYHSEGVPLVTSKNLKGGDIDFSSCNFISEQDHKKISKHSKVDAGDILYAMIGTIGNPVLVGAYDFDFSIKNVALFKQADNSKICSKFLLHFLQTDIVKWQFKKKTRGGTQKFVSLKNIRNLQIPLPPLAEQQRIAEILDKADALREQRKQSIALLDKLLQSVFLDMFGDPVTNPMGWEVAKLDTQVITNPKLDKTKLSNNLNKITSFVPMSSVSDIQQCVTEYEMKPLKEVIKGFTTFEKSDIILAKITPCFENKKLAFLSNMPTPIGFGSTEFHVFRVTNKEIIKPIFLKYILKQDYFFKVGKFKMRGAVGQRRVPIDFFKNFSLILPPLEIQNQFAHIVEKIEAQKALQQAQLKQLDNLFGCLQQKAFSGEL